jgi:hypothetical protein
MVDLSNDNNWVEISDESRQISGTPSRTNRIDPIRISIPFLSPYFQIFAANSQAKIGWWLAGSVELFVGSVEAFVPIRVEPKIIPLNEWQLVYFPLSESQNWHLQFDTAYWHSEIDIAVKQYIE